MPGGPLPVAVDLGDGKTRTLLYGTAALARIEQRYRAPGDKIRLVTDIVLNDPFGSHFVATFLWGGRLHAEPTLTYEEVCAEMDAARGKGIGLVELTAPIAQALIEADIGLKRKLPNGHDEETSPDPTPGPASG